MTWASRSCVRQEGQVEEITEAPAASSAGSVRPPSAEMSSRMRMKDILPSRKRGSKEVGLPEDPSLKPPEGSQMGTRCDVGVAPANDKVADWFGDMGFERGLVVDYATGWDMDGEEQMEEVERRVRDEEPVLLIGSPMCRAFSTLIELTRSTGKFERHLRLCFMMYAAECKTAVLAWESVGCVVSVSSRKCR